MAKRVSKTEPVEADIPAAAESVMAQKPIKRMMRVICDGALNLRRGPHKSYEAITELPSGAEVEALELPLSYGVPGWAMVLYDTGDGIVVGWSMMAYLEELGDGDA